MLSSTKALVAALCLLGPCAGARTEMLGANPIRKVVTLMQNMQKEIEAEGDKEKALFDKFMCYCSGNTGDLQKSLSDAKALAEELSAKHKSEEAEKSQNSQELAQHKKDREAARQELAEASTIREKESADYAELAADTKTNIVAVGKAIPALEQGMGAASFLQTPGGDILGKLADSFPFSDENDQRTLTAFLESGTSDGASGDYVPQSGQIVGILKQMKDTMESNLKEATDNEEQSKASFASLKASKEQQVVVNSQAIESKTARAGELAVSVVETKDDLQDTEAEAADTEKFLAKLEEDCATKTKEWAERQKMQAEEISAISEAISILNDDDALDVFKKAGGMPSALLERGQLGFLQKSAPHTPASSLRKAQAILEGVAQSSKSHKGIMNIMLFTLSSKLKLHSKRQAEDLSLEKFAEVNRMVDEMIDVEGKEQGADDKEKPWCDGEFDKSAREEKTEKNEISNLDADIDEQTDMIEGLDEEIATLSTEIADLDKAVSEATEQRKKEHEEYLESQLLGQTALNLVNKARNRLQKFYNPVLYKAAPVKEMTMEEKILTAGGAGFFAQIQSHVAPPPPPEAPGAYKTSGKSAGVISLMDTIIKELENDDADMAFAEKESQKDYEELMADSKEARAKKMDIITSKELMKSNLVDKRSATKTKEKADKNDVEQILDYVDDLHKSCDFILENYAARKEARGQEVESLKNAKAVLAGANLR